MLFESNSYGENFINLRGDTTIEMNTNIKPELIFDSVSQIFFDV